MEKTDFYKLMYDIIRCLDRVEFEKQKNEKHSEDNQCNYDYRAYVKSIAEKIGCKYTFFKTIFERLLSTNKGSAISMVLKEISNQYESNYNESISDCQYLTHVYVLNLVSKKIQQIEISKVKDWDSFAYFRIFEHAKYAYNVIKPLL